jgi:pimeloyl-ACP methyl ester carboxylesterase
MGELCFGRPEVISDRDYLISAAEHAWRAGLPWVHSATVSSLRGLMAGYLSRGSASFAASAAAVDVPTLVVWGTRDRLVDVRLSKRAETAYRHGSLLVLAECGHVPQLEDPWTTARGILGLWQQVRPTETAAADGHADQDQVGRAAAVRSARCGNLVA